MHRQQHTGGKTHRAVSGHDRNRIRKGFPEHHIPINFISHTLLAPRHWPSTSVGDDRGEKFTCLAQLFRAAGEIGSCPDDRLRDFVAGLDTRLGGGKL